jgi:hypothetical protein
MSDPKKTTERDDDFEEREYARERQEKAYEDRNQALAEQGF